MRFIGVKNRAMLEKYAKEELGEWKNYFALCIQMARAVNRMHVAGLAHSDLSPNNVLVDPSKGTSLVIDIDSLVVPGLFPPDVAGTKGYIAPEVLATLSAPTNARKYPDVKTDRHALAVLIYQYLLLRHPLDGRKIPHAYTGELQELLTYGSQALYCEHPNDKSNRPEGSYMPASALGKKLSDMFMEAFVNGLHDPSKRPTTVEWLNALLKTWDMMVPCSNRSCWHKSFILNGTNNLKCTFCGTKPETNVPLLKLKRESQPGKFSLDRELVVFHYLSLYKWHAYYNEVQGPDVDKTPQAYFVFHEGKWLMINQNLSSLTSPGGNKVPPGKAIELTDGVQFKFSQEPHGRLAEVQMVRV